MDWITQHIAIGGFQDARKLFETADNNNPSSSDIDAILCFKDDCKLCDYQSDKFNMLHLRLEDGSGNNVKDIDFAVEFIDDVVSAGEKILVHCHAGRSRSVCIVARYFMIKHNMTSHQALEKIEKKRGIYLSPGIDEILKIMQ